MKTIILLTLLSLALLPAMVRAEGNDNEKATMARMAQEHQHDAPKPTQAATTEPARPVSAEEVTYGNLGGKPLRGYLAKPKDAKEALPGILVIHEWWGLNDNIRAMTRRLAGEGYTALAVDLYGGQVATTPDKAMEMVNATMKDRSSGEQNLWNAYNFLEMQQKAPKIGVIGWCFGGGWSLGTALLLPDKIDATVIYYGHLETDKDKLATLKMPVLGFFGGQDKSIPVDSVRQFEKTLKELGKSVEVHVYDDANHAFANASGGSYNPKAAEDAWKRTTAFFHQHLQGK